LNRFREAFQAVDTGDEDALHASILWICRVQRVRELFAISDHSGGAAKKSLMEDG
jgi:hypothetical protein